MLKPFLLLAVLAILVLPSCKTEQVDINNDPVIRPLSTREVQTVNNSN